LTSELQLSEKVRSKTKLKLES